MFAQLKDARSKKVYISSMKKTAMVLIVLALLAGTLFANGSPEEQMFIDNLMRNSQSATYASGTTSRTTTKGSEIISRDMATLERLYQYVEKNYLYDIDYDAVYEAMATALFDALGDKYTYYVTADESEDYEEEVSGKGVVSEGMILSAEDKDGRLVLLTPSDLVTSGCSVG